jgi:putative DNA primase/helicase
MTIDTEHSESTAIRQAITWESLKDLPIWLTWRFEIKEEGKLPTKVPYCPFGGTLRHASTTDHTTWGTLPQANEYVTKWGDKLNGVGVVMTDTKDKLAIIGVDLDTCMDANGLIAPWAEDVIKRFDSYTETSPSGSGCKVFACITLADKEVVRQALDGKPGRKWASTGMEHGPAIELYTAGRYFTLTGRWIDETPEDLRVVDKDTLLWLIHTAGPQFLEDYAADAKTRGNGRDDSRSAVAFRIGCVMARAGKTYQQFCNAVRDNPQTASWYSEKGVIDGERELKNIWNKMGGTTAQKPDSAADSTNQLVIGEMEDVEMEAVTWYWPKVIPRGKIMLIAGDAKLGKSTVGLSLAATLTTAGMWPDGTQCREKCSVLIMSTEDDIADTIKPRLVAMGADIKRCKYIKMVKTADGEREFRLDVDLPLLEQALQQIPDLGVAVVDPLVSYINVKDPNNQGEIRQKLEPLGKLAQKYGVTIIAIMHFRKGGDGATPIHQIAGSVAFGAIARAAYVVSKDKNDPDRRLFLSMGNTFAKSDAGFAYRIIEERVDRLITATAIQWEGAVDITAEEALAKDAEPKGNKIEMAMAWLSTRLAEGAVLGSQLQAEIKAQGVMSWRTVQDASRRLGVIQEKEKKFGGKMEWRLGQ